MTVLTREKGKIRKKRAGNLYLSEGNHKIFGESALLLGDFLEKGRKEKFDKSRLIEGRPPNKLVRQPSFFMPFVYLRMSIILQT